MFEGTTTSGSRRSRFSSDASAPCRRKVDSGTGPGWNSTRVSSYLSEILLQNNKKTFRGTHNFATKVAVDVVKQASLSCHP